MFKIRLLKKYCHYYKNMLTYCLKSNNNAKNIGLRKVTMTNQVIKAKSKCATRMANKSRFLKQKHNKKVVGIKFSYINFMYKLLITFYITIYKLFIY